MIRTQGGLNVQIIGVINEHRVFVRDIDHPEFAGPINLRVLTATRGACEITDAVKSVSNVDEAGNPR